MQTGIVLAVGQEDRIEAAGHTLVVVDALTWIEVALDPDHRVEIPIPADWAPHASAGVAVHVRVITYSPTPSPPFHALGDGRKACRRTLRELTPEALR